MEEYLETRAFTNQEEKNVNSTIQQNKPSSEMDATPLEDLYNPPVPPSVQNGPKPEAPPVSMEAQKEESKSCTTQATSAITQSTQNKATVSLPFVCNMTDEQIEALLVGTASILAFSQPIQERLMEVFPSLYENGTAGFMAVIITGLLAAVGFYFGKRILPRLVN